MAHGGLLDIRCDNAHLAETGGDFGERGDAGTVNAVVVTDKDAQFHSLDETQLGVLPGRMLLRISALSCCATRYIDAHSSGAQSESGKRGTRGRGFHKGVEE